jgi:hypothetical protein
LGELPEEIVEHATCFVHQRHPLRGERRSDLAQKRPQAGPFRVRAKEHPGPREQQRNATGASD